MILQIFYLQNTFMLKFIQIKYKFILKNEEKKNEPKAPKRNGKGRTEKRHIKHFHIQQNLWLILS